MDLAALPPTARRELEAVLQDEFCHCGCPHTLGACLSSHGGCSHARNSARLAATWAAAGASASEIILALSRYHASFREPRASLQVDARMCVGREEAPVTLVEFADFECPSCARVRPVLEAFARAHADTVRLCYAPYPLPMHAHAGPAAQAALWARDQGQFWPMHDALYEHQHDLSTSALVAIAERLGLSGSSLRKALEAQTYAPEVEHFLAQGRQARVSGTPTLYVNGRAHALRPLEEELVRSVEDELEWSTHGNAWAVH